MYGNRNQTMFHLGKLHNIWMTLSFKYVLLIFIYFISMALIAVKIGFWYILIHELKFCIIYHNKYCLAVSVIKLPRIHFCLYRPILQSVFFGQVLSWFHPSLHLCPLICPSVGPKLRYQSSFKRNLTYQPQIWWGDVQYHKTDHYKVWGSEKIIMIKCKWSRNLDETNCKLQNHPKI